MIERDVESPGSVVVIAKPAPACERAVESTQSACLDHICRNQPCSHLEFGRYLMAVAPIHGSVVKDSAPGRRSVVDATDWRNASTGVLIRDLSFVRPMSIGNTFQLTFVDRVSLEYVPECRGKTLAQRSVFGETAKVIFVAFHFGPWPQTMFRLAHTA